MARTILEDYYQDTSSQFELAYKIPQRAREIMRSDNARVKKYNDKPIVLALREISERASRYENAEEEETAASAATDAADAADATDAADAAPAEAPPEQG